MSGMATALPTMMQSSTAKPKKAEEGQHRRGHKLQARAEIRETNQRACAVGDERDEQVRTERDGEAAEQIREKQISRRTGRAAMS